MIQDSLQKPEPNNRSRQKLVRGDITDLVPDEDALLTSYGICIHFRLGTPSHIIDNTIAIL